MIDNKVKTIQELEELLDQQKMQWTEELKALKMKMELERLRQLDKVWRQLEEVRCQGDKEHVRFREEQERTAILL